MAPSRRAKRRGKHTGPEPALRPGKAGSDGRPGAPAWPRQRERFAAVAPASRALSIERKAKQRPRPKSPVARPGSAAEAPQAPRPTPPPSLGGWFCEILLAQLSWPTYCRPSSAGPAQLAQLRSAYISQKFAASHNSTSKKIQTSFTSCSNFRFPPSSHLPTSTVTDGCV